MNMRRCAHSYIQVLRILPISSSQFMCSNTDSEIAGCLDVIIEVFIDHIELEGHALGFCVTATEKFYLLTLSRVPLTFSQDEK